MPVARFQMPDGRIGRFEVPEGTTPEQAQAMIEQSLAGEKPKDTRTPAQRVMQTGAAGALRGAGSIGATILVPMDMLNSALLGRPAMSGNNERREGMDAAFRGMGVDTDSLAYQIPKVGAEVAGTMGVGPAIAAGARAVPAIASRAAPLLDAIGTAGMRAGGMTGAKGLGVRSGGAAITGGAAAGLVDPQQAGAGAVLGGALPVATKTAGVVGKAVGKAAGNAATNILGLSTGAGAEPIKQAFKAGATRNQSFLDNIRGDVPLTDVLDEAKRGLEAMRAAKSTQYRSGMVPIKGDKTALNFADVDSALNDAWNVSSFKGQVKNERAASAVQKMQDAIEQWKQLDQAEFHTPEGMDALKQKLAGILEEIPYQERAARLAAGKVHAAVKDTINKQAPAYAKVMKDYQAASEQITEIERALSLGNKAAADTAMRKLQSLMRNNVQTNYGNRLTLANTLEQQGGVELLPAISGQALNSWTPRSLSGQLGSGGAVLGSLMTGNPLPLAALPFQSPRLMGGAAYQLGKLGSPSAGAQAGPGLLGGAQAPGQLTNEALMALLYRGAPVVAAGR